METLPSNDRRRLEVLRRYQILDTFPEASFDRLTRLVAQIFGTPMSLITLIDQDRQWFKSTYGLDASETPLSVSFCRHAIEGEGVLVVPDARKDDRFSDNPYVTGDLGVRFYAGAPLRTGDGTQIGALCVIDTFPRRPLEASEKQILTDLAAIVVDEMELRSAVQTCESDHNRDREDSNI